MSTDRAREAIDTFNAIIDRVEARCLAVDGPVTPTMQEISDEEMAEVWQSLQTIRATFSEGKAHERCHKTILGLPDDVARASQPSSPYMFPRNEGGRCNLEAGHDGDCSPYGLRAALDAPKESRLVKSKVRTLCVGCGPSVKVDEDGCCVTCGRDATHYDVVPAPTEETGKSAARKELAGQPHGPNCGGGDPESPCDCWKSVVRSALVDHEPEYEHHGRTCQCSRCRLPTEGPEWDPGASPETYWCGCVRHARWERCPEHTNLAHDEEPRRTTGVVNDGRAAPPSSGGERERDLVRHRIAFARLLSLMGEAFGEDFTDAPQGVGEAMAYALDLAMGLREWDRQPDNEKCPREKGILRLLSTGGDETNDPDQLPDIRSFRSAWAGGDEPSETPHDVEAALDRIYKHLKANAVELDAETRKVIGDNLWSLYEPSEEER